MRFRFRLFLSFALVTTALTQGRAGATQPSNVHISPETGTYGVTVEITGDGLQDTTAVDFNGVPATFLVDSDTQITTQVPNSATTGPVNVTTPEGSSSSDVPFVVIPIQHVVIIDQENHSFDNVLGKLCVEVRQGKIVRPGANARCDGRAKGKLSTGQTIKLPLSPDIVPPVRHSVEAQATSINDGAMNGFDKIWGCDAGTTPSHACYAQYDPLRPAVSPIANVAALAERYTISDRTFELRNTPSWVGHLVLGNPSANGFQGNNPHPGERPAGPGWGCDSFNDTNWTDGREPLMLVPSCIPDQSGAGPYRDSPVPYEPTIFDRFDAAGRDWHIYEGDGITGGDGWGWSICPTFYSCLGSPQRERVVAANDIIDDAANGTLPALSIVIPAWADSTHNNASMAAGDNFVASVVQAIQADPVDAASTAIFLTWDDCGCFYDHVAPPQQSWGIRVPMIIISPYAKVGYTDHTDATYASLLAFVEHTFGLDPLSQEDAGAYDYRGSFDFTSPHAAGVRVPEPHLIRHRIPKWEKHYMRQHPGNRDDPT
ncbi:MAG: phospholipase [Actinomycetota bacterium]|nr:phospholipase [Actinomycetota bacterium]